VALLGKTNAMRILDAAKISYEACYYEVDESDLSGQAVSQKTGVAQEMMFKTLVLRGERQGIIVCCIPVCEEIDLKRLAVASKDKKVEMVAQKEVLPLTGYIRGGVSPVGMKKKYPMYMDESVLLFDKIAISGGTRGCQLLLDPNSIISLLDINLFDLTKRQQEEKA
jgi:Cys-tRNA(Pro)/Cys-tRNA(Cys) deacylase